jgi:hypothetical protein
MDERDNIPENEIPFSGSTQSQWCTQCGSPLPSMAKYCGKCGTRAFSQSETQPAEMTDRAASRKPPVKEEQHPGHATPARKKKKPFRKLVVGIMIIGGVTAAVFYFSGNLKTSPASLISVISEKVKVLSSPSVSGSADDEKVYPQKIDQATKTIEFAFLSGDKSQVNEVMTENALKQYDKELSAISKEGLIRFGDAFKSRKLNAFSDLYAEYSVMLDGKSFTVAVARQKDGSWKLMRF